MRVHDLFCRAGACRRAVHAKTFERRADKRRPYVGNTRGRALRSQGDRVLRSSAKREAGFSLIEVIAAVVIFSIGMVAMLGLFAPITKSVASC